MKIFALIMIILGMIVLVVGSLGTNGPLQGGAIAAIGVACGLLPYLLYKLKCSSLMLDNQERIIKLLEGLQPRDKA